jgi:NitT/TauT family transport system permease protein
MCHPRTGYARYGVGWAGRKENLQMKALWQGTRRVLQSDVARPIVLILAVLILWQLAVTGLRIPKYLIPSPGAVLQQFSDWPRLLRESLVTTYATLGGFLLSVLVGIPCAVAIAYSRSVESFLYPILVFSQTIPKIAIAPLFIVWFGFGVLPKVIVAFLLGFFPVVVSTVTGFKSVEPEMLDLVRSMKATRMQMFLKISFPHALPHIFSGLKVSITLAVVGAVVGEFVGANSGIGYLLQLANGNFDLPLMFAGLFVLSIIGVILFVALELVEKWVIPWHVSQRSGYAATP